MSETVEQRLAVIFEKVFSIDAAEFKPTLQPEDILRWDSLGHMSLILELEDVFGVQLEVDEITEITSGQKIIDILKAKNIA